MGIRLRLALLAAFVFLAPTPALAAWTYGGASPTADVQRSRTFVSDYLGTTDAQALDTSMCEALTLSWLSSTTDTNAVAKASYFGCTTETLDSSCVQIPTSTASTGSSFGPEKIGNSYPYTILHTTVAPAGGRTARGTLVCEKNQTTPTTGCKSYSFTGSRVFGPIAIYGPTNRFRFTLDGNAATSSTTGALATVYGCDDTGYGSATCSCDMVGGGNSCAYFDGTSGSQGFTGFVPQAVTVTILSAAQAGTFELCTW